MLNNYIIYGIYTWVEKETNSALRVRKLQSYGMGIVVDAYQEGTEGSTDRYYLVRDVDSTMVSRVPVQNVVAVTEDYELLKQTYNTLDTP